MRSLILCAVVLAVLQAASAVTLAPRGAEETHAVEKRGETSSHNAGNSHERFLGLGGGPGMGATCGAQHGLVNVALLNSYHCPPSAGGRRLFPGPGGPFPGPEGPFPGPGGPFPGPGGPFPGPGGPFPGPGGPFPGLGGPFPGPGGPFPGPGGPFPGPFPGPGPFPFPPGPPYGLRPPFGPSPFGPPPFGPPGILPPPCIGGCPPPFPPGVGFAGLPGPSFGSATISSNEESSTSSQSMMFGKNKGHKNDKSS